MLQEPWHSVKDVMYLIWGKEDREQSRRNIEKFARSNDRYKTTDPRIPNKTKPINQTITKTHTYT